MTPSKDPPHPEPARERRVEGRTAAVTAAVAALLLIAAVIGAWLWLRGRGIDLSAMSTADVEAMVKGWAPWTWLGSIALMVLHSFVPHQGDAWQLALDDLSRYFERVAALPK